MKKLEKKEVSRFRLTEQQAKEIDAYCARHNVESRSEFFRYAISRTLRPEFEDPDLVFASLSQMHEKIHSIERQGDITFAYITFLFRHILSYHAEIPQEFKEAATVSAVERFDRVFKSFQNSLKQNPSMFESLLADYFEKH